MKRFQGTLLLHILVTQTFPNSASTQKQAFQNSVEAHIFHCRLTLLGHTQTLQNSLIQTYIVLDHVFLETLVIIQMQLVDIIIT